jgi:hypothetical protein
MPDPIDIASEDIDSPDHTRQRRKRKVRIDKPTYADFRETRKNIRQRECECGGQTWHLWEDGVVSCGTCGLPEPFVDFDLVSEEQAEERLERIMG